MANFDYSHVQVGSNIRDNQKLEDDRVDSITMVGQWVVLITVVSAIGYKRDLYGIIPGAPPGTSISSALHSAVRRAIPAGQKIEVDLSEAFGGTGGSAYPGSSVNINTGISPSYIKTSADRLMGSIERMSCNSENKLTDLYGRNVDRGTLLEMLDEMRLGHVEIRDIISANELAVKPTGTTLDNIITKIRAAYHFKGSYSDDDIKSLIGFMSKNRDLIYSRSTLKASASTLSGGLTSDYLAEVAATLPKSEFTSDIDLANKIDDFIEKIHSSNTVGAFSKDFNKDIYEENDIIKTAIDKRTKVFTELREYMASSRGEFKLNVIPKDFEKILNNLRELGYSNYVDDIVTALSYGNGIYYDALTGKYVRGYDIAMSRIYGLIKTNSNTSKVGQEIRVINKKIYEFKKVQDILNDQEIRFRNIDASALGADDLNTYFEMRTDLNNLTGVNWEDDYDTAQRAPSKFELQQIENYRKTAHGDYFETLKEDKSGKWRGSTNSVEFKRGYNILTGNDLGNIKLELIDKGSIKRQYKGASFYINDIINTDVHGNPVYPIVQGRLAEESIFHPEGTLWRGTGISLDKSDTTLEEAIQIFTSGSKLVKQRSARSAESAQAVPAEKVHPIINKQMIFRTTDAGSKATVEDIIKKVYGTEDYIDALLDTIRSRVKSIHLTETQTEDLANNILGELFISASTVNKEGTAQEVFDAILDRSMEKAKTMRARMIKDSDIRHLSDPIAGEEGSLITLEDTMTGNASWMNPEKALLETEHGKSVMRAEEELLTARGAHIKIGSKGLTKSSDFYISLSEIDELRKNLNISDDGVKAFRKVLEKDSLAYSTERLAKIERFKREELAKQIALTSETPAGKRVKDQIRNLVNKIIPIDEEKTNSNIEALRNSVLRTAESSFRDRTISLSQEISLQARRLDARVLNTYLKEFGMPLDEIKSMLYEERVATFNKFVQESSDVKRLSSILIDLRERDYSRCTKLADYAEATYGINWPEKTFTAAGERFTVKDRSALASLLVDTPLAIHDTKALEHDEVKRGVQTSEGVSFKVIDGELFFTTVDKDKNFDIARFMEMLRLSNESGVGGESLGKGLDIVDEATGRRYTYEGKRIEDLLKGADNLDYSEDFLGEGAIVLTDKKLKQKSVLASSDYSMQILSKNINIPIEVVGSSERAPIELLKEQSPVNLYKTADKNFISSSDPFFKEQLSLMKDIAENKTGNRNIISLDIETYTSGSNLGKIRQLGYTVNAVEGQKLVEKSFTNYDIEEEVQKRLREQLKDDAEENIKRSLEQKIGKDVESEALIKFASELTEDSIILTANKPFDIDRLIAAAGTKDSAEMEAVVKKLNESVERNIDLITLGQIFDISLPGGHSVQNMLHKLVSKTAAEQHEALSDARDEVSLLSRMMYGEKGMSGRVNEFDTILSSKINLTKEKKYFWNSRVGRLYTLDGIIADKEGTSSAVMHEVFRNGEISDVAYKFAPRGEGFSIGRLLSSSFTEVKKNQGLVLLNENIQNLAMNKVRKALVDYNEARDLYDVYNLLYKDGELVDKDTIKRITPERIEDEISERKKADPNFDEDLYRSERTREMNIHQRALSAYEDPRNLNQYADIGEWEKHEYEPYLKKYADELAEISAGTGNAVWRDLTAGIDAIVPPNTVDIYREPGARRVAFMVPELGENAVSIGVDKPLSWNRDVENITIMLAKKREVYISQIEGADTLMSRFVIGDDELRSMLSEYTESVNESAKQGIEHFIKTRDTADLTTEARSILADKMWEKKISEDVKNNLTAHAVRITESLGITEKTTPSELRDIFISIGQKGTLTPDETLALTYVHDTSNRLAPRKFNEANIKEIDALFNTLKGMAEPDEAEELIELAADNADYYNFGPMSTKLKHGLEDIDEVIKERLRNSAHKMSAEEEHIVKKWLADNEIPEGEELGDRLYGKILGRRVDSSVAPRSEEDIAKIAEHIKNNWLDDVFSNDEFFEQLTDEDKKKVIDHSRVIKDIEYKAKTAVSLEDLIDIKNPTNTDENLLQLDRSFIDDILNSGRLSVEAVQNIRDILETGMTKSDYVTSRINIGGKIGKELAAQSTRGPILNKTMLNISSNVSRVMQNGGKEALALAGIVALIGMGTTRPHLEDKDKSTPNQELTKVINETKESLSVKMSAAIHGELYIPYISDQQLADSATKAVSSMFINPSYVNQVSRNSDSTNGFSIFDVNNIAERLLRRGRELGL